MKKLQILTSASRDHNLVRVVGDWLKAALIGVNAELVFRPDEDIRLTVVEFRRWRSTVVRITEVALETDAADIRDRIEETIDENEDKLSSVVEATSLVVAMVGGIRQEKMLARESEVEDGPKGQGG